MPNPNLSYRGAAGARETAAFDEGLRKHMLSVYNYMGLGLVLTGAVALIVASMLAPLAFVLLFSFRIQTMTAGGAQAMFWAFCAVMGLSLASVFLVFTGTSIARTFFIAAAMFGATSLYGYTTKRDLSQFGSFLIMGLIGVVIASLVNLFLASST